MKYEFNKKLKKVTVTADNFDDVLDVKELRCVGDIIGIDDIEYVTRPLHEYLSPKLVIYTDSEGGVDDLKFMAMSRTFKPFKVKTANKD